MIIDDGDRKIIIMSDSEYEENDDLEEKLEKLHIYEEKPEISYDKSILSIDIGVKHLGISVGYVSECWKLLEITWVDLIDITKFTHINCLKGLSECNCELRHTRTIADWMEHIFHEYSPIFEECNYILVERQPITGLVAVEQIIFYRWREKCVLVSPRSMHKYFNLSHYDYERRKQKTEKIAESVNWHTRARQRYQCYARKHDISDSICLMLYWLHKKNILWHEQKHKQEIAQLRLTGYGMHIDEWFAQFRFSG